MKFEGKVAVVTGAAGAGIGQMVARALASEGARVVLSDAHERRTKEVAEDIAKTYNREVLGLTVNVLNRDEVDEMIDRALETFGRIDILVNNAGRNVQAPLVDMSDENWELVINVNLRGAFYCTRSALKPMIAQKSGNIVFLSSVAGWLGEENGAPYAAAKAGIMGLTKSVALEVGQYNVRVNAIAPGLIYNEFLRRIYPADFFTEWDKHVPLGRRGAPEDIAKTVLFLVSDDSSYITGETICVSGGSYMR
ncbi:MAG: SDR family NAD(P)-dependent oxidoreductase [Dehalococcoidia bacterium]